MHEREPAPPQPAPGRRRAATGSPDRSAVRLPVLPVTVPSLQRTAGNRAVTSMLHTPAVPVQRREVQQEIEPGRAQDWTTADRLGNTARWQAACKRNLDAADSAQYATVAERRDFYRWFYEHTAEQGFTTRWAFAAHLVATGAEAVTGMAMVPGIGSDVMQVADVELQGMMREANQTIFDNVLPKLRDLLKGGPLTGKAALDWDMKILSEEQQLIQPLYDRVSKKTIDQLDHIARKQGVVGHVAELTGADKVAAGRFNNAGVVPPFSGKDITAPADRWTYGMNLGKQFAPGGTEFDPGKHTMPTPGAGYLDGDELRKVDDKARLHQLDAWLSPTRFVRPPDRPASELKEIIAGLSPSEKMIILADRSADGWAYSAQFAQFDVVDESLVRQALPSTPETADAVAAFLKRYYR